MQHVRVFGRRKRPSDPIPAARPRASLTPFNLTACFLRSQELHVKVDFVVRLIRTPPGDERNRALVRALRQLEVRVPSTLTRPSSTC